MDFNTFVLLLKMWAFSFCDGDYLCQEVIIDCVLDGESIEFCTDSDYIREGMLNEKYKIE